MRGRRAARIAVSLDVLHKALHMPEDMRLERVTSTFSEAWVNGQCTLWVSSPQLPEITELATVPYIDPVIEHRDESYVWDFGE